MNRWKGTSKICWFFEQMVVCFAVPFNSSVKPVLPDLIRIFFFLVNILTVGILLEG